MANQIKLISRGGVEWIDGSIATCSQCNSHIEKTESIHQSIWDSNFNPPFTEYTCTCGHKLDLSYNKFGQLVSSEIEDDNRTYE